MDFFKCFFFFWSLLQFSPTTTSKTPAAEFTQSSCGPSLSRSVFHFGKPQVLTAISCELLVWNVTDELVANQDLHREKITPVQLQRHPVTVLTVTDR